MTLQHGECCGLEELPVSSIHYRSFDPGHEMVDSKRLLLILFQRFITAWQNRLLKAQESGQGSVEIMTQNDPKLTTKLELGVRFGKTVVIEEVDQIDPILVPVLRKDLALEGPRKAVNIGEKKIDYDGNFKIYLATRNPDPDLPPNTAAIVCMVSSGWESGSFSRLLMRSPGQL